MRKRIGVLSLLALFVCGALFAQGDPSAKFAAVWSDEDIGADSAAGFCSDGTGDPFDIDFGEGWDSQFRIVDLTGATKQAIAWRMSCHSLIGHESE